MNTLKLHYLAGTYLIDIIDPWKNVVCIYSSKIKDEAEGTFDHLQEVLEVNPINMLELN